MLEFRDFFIIFIYLFKFILHTNHKWVVCFLIRRELLWYFNHVFLHLILFIDLFFAQLYPCSFLFFVLIYQISLL